MKKPSGQMWWLTGLFLCEASMLADVIPEVAAVEEVHHEIEVLSILEGIVHVDYEGVVELCEDLALVHD